MVIVAITSLVATVAIPLMTKAVIDGPVRHQDQHGLWVLGAAATGVGISEAVLWFIRRWLVSRATMGVEADIRKDLYARLQILPMSFHGRWQSGQLLSRIMNDLSTIRRFMSFGMVFLLLNVIQITVVTAILLAMYWPLGVVVLVSIVPITLTVLHFQQVYTRLSRLAQDQSGHVATHVEESALGVRVVKSFGREDYTYDRFDKQLTDLYETQVGRVSVSAKFWTFLEIIPNLTLIVVLGFGALRGRPRLRHHGHAGRVHHDDALAGVARRVAGLPAVDDPGVDDRGRPDRRDLRRATTKSPTGRRTRRRAAAAANWSTSASASRTRRRGLGLRDVTLDSRTGRDPGAGRRHRFGQVGADRAAVAAVRRHRGCDPHRRRKTSASCPCPRCAGGGHRVRGPDPVLDVGARRTCASAGRTRRTSRSTQAIEIAQAQFVHDLPLGLDTRIGEQGMSLSGGQRQRLALARAVLAAPAVLVLDDTLSALDVHTEAVVEEALRRVLHAVTGIVVAHRASTVLLADRVALLQDGTITHVGTHAELLGERAAVPLPAGRRRRARRRRRAELRLAGRRDRNRLGQSYEEQEAPERDDQRAWLGRGGRGPMHGADGRRGAAVAAPRTRRRPAHRREPAAPSQPRAAGSLLRPYRLTVAAARARRRHGERCAAVRSAAGAARHRPRRAADPVRWQSAHALMVDRRRAVRGGAGPGRQPDVLPAAVRPDRPGGAARAAPPGLPALPAARRRVPRPLHLGPGGHPADQRRRGHPGAAGDGFDGLITAVLTLIGTAVLLVTLDVRLGLMCLAASRSGGAGLLVPRESAKTYRRVRESAALVIVQFVETMTGIRAVQAYRREPRNQEIFEDIAERYRGEQRADLPAARDLHARREAGRQHDHRCRAALRRLPRHRRPDDHRHPGGVPAVPADVLRADAGDLASSTTRSSPRRRRSRSSPASSRRSPAIRTRSDPSAAGRRAATSTSTTCSSATSPERPVLPDLASHPGRARRSRWSARPGPARRRSPSSCRGSTTRPAGTVTLDGVDLRD